jgi:hypothetical protein
MAAPSPENPIPDILSPENSSADILSTAIPSMDITTRIQEVFNEPEITKQTIYLSTDLEPDDMMAIKLLAPKFKKCKTLYVVIGEHTLGDIKNKCYLFYYLATLYGFDNTIFKSTTTNKPIIFTGHPSAEEKFYPSTIFNKEILLNGATKMLADHFADSIHIIDITTTMTRDCLHNKLIDLNPIFILMKPPKEFFYPERYDKKFQNNVAIMYGSFNVNELNELMTLKKLEKIGLSDIISIFPEIVYIERKPEVAIYPQKKGEKLEPIDPNPFFGTFDPLNQFKILGDTDLLSKIKAAYDTIVGLESENTNFLKYCTKQWQLTTLTKVGTLLNIKFIDEKNIKIDETDIDKLINFFKRTYFQDTIPIDANFEEETEGYYPKILDTKKLCAFRTKLSLREKVLVLEELEDNYFNTDPTLQLYKKMLSKLTTMLSKLTTMLTSVDDKQTFDTAADEYNKLASTKLAKDSGINLSTLTDLKEKEIKTHTKSIESAQEKRELKIAEAKENEDPINKAIRETTNLDESFAKKIAQQLKKKTKNKWGMMIGIVLTNGEQTPLADQIIAAVILEPQSFTIKKIQRDNTDIHTILCSESIQDIEKLDIEKLKSNSLNDDKLQLYKTILDIITRHSDPIYGLNRKPIREIPKKTGPMKATEKFGGKKRTKKRNHKKTTNEEPKPKRKQEQTRKKKRHSMTSDS